ncbi:MAG: hypothetical protein IOC42_00045, partial [Methylobacterium sp.]|nr:hypothetical protein [Methylobacterium sp.]
TTRNDFDGKPPTSLLGYCFDWIPSKTPPPKIWERGMTTSSASTSVARATGLSYSYLSSSTKIVSGGLARTTVCDDVIRHRLTFAESAHAGAFDLAYLCCLPNMVVMAAADEAELVHMVRTCAAYDDGPIALRYPRGDGVGVEMPERGEILPIGKGRIIREGNRIAILSLGTRLGESLKAAEELEKLGLSTSVADARFAKPLDRDLIRRLAGSHEVLITIEEGSRGGFGAMVLHALAEEGLLDGGLAVRTMTLPDSYQDHDTPARQYAEAGLDAAGIVKTVREVLARQQSRQSARA